MDSITQNKRYLPHENSTKINSVKLYRQTKDIGFVCRRYHISKASLMRWNKQYDGTKESLEPKSHKPLTPHPHSHTEEELKWIKDYHRRTPNISICELYGKLREDKAYSRHPGSLYRIFVRLGFRKKVESTKKKSKHLGKYDTPEAIGEKWQMDVKYAPNILQTDNGGEFTHTQKTKRIHPLDVFCNAYGIVHKTICPRTPWHNGKVERSHRNDQERFYNHLKFYSFNDLQEQMKRYLYRSNNIPMAVLGWKSPNQKQHELGGR